MDNLWSYTNFAEASEVHESAQEYAKSLRLLELAFSVHSSAYGRSTTREHQAWRTACHIAYLCNCECYGWSVATWRRQSACWIEHGK